MGKLLPTSLPDARPAFMTPSVLWQEDDEGMLCAYADIGTNAAAEGIFRQVLTRYNPIFLIPNPSTQMLPPRAFAAGAGQVQP